MSSKRQEIETLLLAMYAAVPMYFTYAMGKAPLIAFHVIMGCIVLRVALGKGPELIPSRVMRWLAVAYPPLYAADVFLSRGPLIASMHLVLFIAIYQPIESLQRPNQAQRLLTASLIFIASVATSTHLTILPFVLVFAFLMFRQLMYVSHLETARALDRSYAEAPSGKAAAFYLLGATAIGAVIFPMLPRLRSPFVHGISGTLTGSSTALSESIDFARPRLSSADTTVVARVWLDPQARAFFTPIRLRGMIYDRYSRGEWKQTYRGLRDVEGQAGNYVLAKRGGVSQEATVQQRTQRGRLFMPVGAHAVSGMPARLYEGPSAGTYFAYHEGMMNFRAQMSLESEPLRMTRVATPMYPITPEVAALARTIVGNEPRIERRAQLIEQYLAGNYRFVPNPATLRNRTMSVDEFLLRERAGHCEYFAAGMVVLLASLDVPARIAGGFYGGRYNPLGGYYAIRRDDAHAWTEVWNGTRWVTYDATPPDLRPGAQRAGALREYLVGISDTATFIWDRYVLTFGLGDQVALAEELMARARQTATSLKARLHSDARQLVSPLFLSLLGFIVALGLALTVLVRRRRPLFESLSAYLVSCGIEVGPAMTIEEGLRELREKQPEAARELEPLVTLYEEEVFSGRRDRGRPARIRRRLAELSG